MTAADTGGIAEMFDESAEDFPLLPVDFDTLSDGRAYLFASGRLTPRADEAR